MPTLRADPSLLPSACPTQQARVGCGRTSVGCRPGRWGATTRHYSASTLASHRPVGIQDSGTQESVTRPPVSSALHSSPGALPKAWRIGEPLGAGANWRIESRSKGRVPPGPRLSATPPPTPQATPLRIRFRLPRAGRCFGGVCHFACTGWVAGTCVAFEGERGSRSILNLEIFHQFGDPEWDCRFLILRNTFRRKPNYGSPTVFTKVSSKILTLKKKKKLFWESETGL